MRRRRCPRRCCLHGRCLRQKSLLYRPAVNAPAGRAWSSTSLCRCPWRRPGCSATPSRLWRLAASTLQANPALPASRRRAALPPAAAAANSASVPPQGRMRSQTTPSGAARAPCRARRRRRSHRRRSEQCLPWRPEPEPRTCPNPRSTPASRGCGVRSSTGAARLPHFCRSEGKRSSWRGCLGRWPGESTRRPRSAWLHFRPAS
mmetsp:Transcript_5442/g.14991  ORF Transcript_5442/g.14991 Transcript_5442/m.14991 type:complete len:204 (-) Transcript_5442:246-857(-)